jgi:hypothetical protein
VPVELAITRCLADLASLGYSGATLIQTGMQGLVFRLDEELVAKVWPGASARQVKTLNGLQAFYRALARHDLPFMTPQIHQIVRLEDTMVTIERALPGAQLRSSTVQDPRTIQRSTIDCLSTVLHALASIRCSAALRPPQAPLQVHRQVTRARESEIATRASITFDERADDRLIVVLSIRTLGKHKREKGHLVLGDDRSGGIPIHKREGTSMQTHEVRWMKMAMASDQLVYPPGPGDKKFEMVDDGQTIVQSLGPGTCRFASCSLQGEPMPAIRGRGSRQQGWWPWERELVKLRQHCADSRGSVSRVTVPR